MEETRRRFCFCFRFVSHFSLPRPPPPPPPQHADLCCEHEKTQRQRDDQASSECEVTEERRRGGEKKKKYLNDGDVSHLPSDSRRPRGRSQDILIAQVIATPPVAGRSACGRPPSRDKRGEQLEASLPRPASGSPSKQPADMESIGGKFRRRRKEGRRLTCRSGD